ncbi:hypothetical protein EV193_102673 [Herbihabitans rhizosphaerae]|uniref:Uncharacterized protein n=1 Tax=Herbihabitans rhizosphaerae TaxID=1872711 RepID=A0A4Q7L5Y8_9PSEU|nr:hypothetical protein EV193_102673 [Herbihabitans rhizosphaerae]
MVARAEPIVRFGPAELFRTGRTAELTVLWDERERL